MDSLLVLTLPPGGKADYRGSKFYLCVCCWMTDTEAEPNKQRKSTIVIVKGMHAFISFILIIREQGFII